MEETQWRPRLEGSLLRLVPLEPDHFEALYEAASDPKIWEMHPHPLRYQRPVFETFFAGALESKGAVAILERERGAVIGSSRYYHHELENCVVRIGYTFLVRKYWGGLYNHELKSLMLRHAFQFVDRVLFEVGPKNFRSQRAMEKIGGRLTKEKAVPIENRLSNDHLVYEIRGTEFSALALKK